MNANASTAHARPVDPIFIAPVSMWVTLLIVCAALGLAFAPALQALLGVWFESEEFNYGPILPFVCGFLIWQQRDAIERATFQPSWLGFAVATLAVGGALIGQLAAVPVLTQVGVVFALAGATLAVTGWQVFRKLLGAFGVLLLAIPLPAFLLNSLSLQMQLISSQIGVAIVRLFGISVFLEGNVIDLGVYKLEVAEACNGLRYLFPLLTLGFLMAYMFKTAWWKRAVLFLSAIPISILMNSARIGVIGVLVDRWGTGMAEGFMHDFQGWAVFMLSTAVLVLEMIVIAKIGSDGRPWREVFGLEFPPPRSPSAARISRTLDKPLIAITAVTVAVAAALVSTPPRTEIVPQREPLVLFPNQLGAWTSQRGGMDKTYLDALKLSDYVLADYRSPGRNPINFYVAWYDSQRSGQSVHSPRSCLPGGGWEIKSLKQIDVTSRGAETGAIRVNRALISLGRQRQLTYYWFQQRGRNVTNEYLVKWYLFWDALTRNRSDGALVRLVIPLTAGVTEEQADDSLKQFLALATPELPRFIPN